MAESIQRWQTRIWIGSKIDQPVTIFGASLDDLRQGVQRFLEQEQPTFFSNASPNYQGTRRTSYLLTNETQSSEPPGWYWLDDRLGPSRLNSFQTVVRHFLGAMLIEHGPAYEERAEWRHHPLHRIRALLRLECQSVRDWLCVEEYLQDGWCVLRGGFLASDKREEVILKKRTLLLGHPNLGEERLADSRRREGIVREGW